MGVLTDVLKAGVAGEVSKASGNTFKTVARVIDRNEESNLCTVAYRNKDGNLQQLTEVFVDLRNKGWFPSKDEYVLLEIKNNSALILSKYVSDYQREVRAKEKLKNDTLPDTNGTCVGGEIL